jgi:Family of unknown function (DUF6869)
MMHTFLKAMNSDAELRQLIAGYWKYYALSTGDRRERLEADQWFWAWEEVERAVRAPSANVFPVLIALVESAANDDALAYVGAGPLEDLINWHGAQFLDQIEESARRDRAFRTALATVRVSDSAPAAIRDRLARFMPPPFT